MTIRNMSAKEKRIKYLAAETLRDGGVRGKSYLVRDRERLNTGLLNCVSCNVPYRITLTDYHQITIIIKAMI